jgi:hypothetical protein
LRLIHRVERILVADLGDQQFSSVVAAVFLPRPSLEKTSVLLAVVD